MEQLIDKRSGGDDVPIAVGFDHGELFSRVKRGDRGAIIGSGTCQFHSVGLAASVPKFGAIEVGAQRKTVVVNYPKLLRRGELDKARNVGT